MRLPASSCISLSDLHTHFRLAVFFPYATEIGFFLNIPRFQASMMQGYPPGHPSRPAPALIFAVYLWSIRLSDDPSVKSRESAYLFRATQDAATALSGTHPSKVIHSIQAEVLLATYFFANGRFFEGKHHVANAVSTALSSGMHKIRSAAPGQQSTRNRISSPRDPVEEGERIIGAWTVLTLDKVWATVLEHTPNFEDSTHVLGTQVDTPWPLEMEDFEQACHLYTKILVFILTCFAIYRAVYRSMCAQPIPYRISSQERRRLTRASPAAHSSPRQPYSGIALPYLHASAAEVRSLLSREIIQNFLIYNPPSNFQIPQHSWHSRH